MLALTAFAALTGAGAVAAFSFAWNLQSVPLSLIAASYGLAAFPALSSLWAVGKRDEFIVTIRSALRRILWWSSLAIILCVVFRTEIVGVILGSGAFETQSVETTATVFALFVISLAAQGVSLLLTRGYYAAGYTRTPLIAALCGAAFSIFLAFLFMHSGGVFALPLAFSLGSIVSALWLYARFPRDFHSA
jgi:putative peptidoglycan lipid II flippase